MNGGTHSTFPIFAIAKSPDRRQFWHKPDIGSGYPQKPLPMLPDPPNFAPEPGIRIATLPSLAAQGRWRLDGLRAQGSHGYFWITRGQAQITVRSHTRGAGTNVLIYVPSGHVHGVALGKNIQGYAVWMHQDLPVPAPDHTVMIKAASIFEQGQITSYFEAIAQEDLSRGPGTDHATESWMTLLNVWIDRHQSRNDWQNGALDTGGTRLVNRFLERLERDFARGVAVADLAATLGVTPTHLSRVCRDYLGKPASGLLHDRIILQAKLNLLLEHSSITDIAAGLGIATPAYFSRLFKQQTGRTPGQFRTDARAGKIPNPPAKPRRVKPS